MCAASLVYHQETVLAFDANHFARTISTFRGPSIMEPVILVGHGNICVSLSCDLLLVACDEEREVHFRGAFSWSTARTHSATDTHE
jgi:hypothetical protein